MIYSLPTPGLWTVVVDHGLISATTTNLFTITVETDSGAQCVNFCSSIPYALSLVAGFTNRCYCQDGFAWNSGTSKCVINCTYFNTTGTVGTIVSGTVDKCNCLSAIYSWTTSPLQCTANCSLVTYSTGINTAAGDCICMADYIWSPSLTQCVRNCSNYPYATTVSLTNID